MFLKQREGIWFPIEVKVSQSDAETPLSHTSTVICCIMGKLAFVTGNIVLTENGTSGKSIRIKLPVFLEIIKSAGEQQFIFGTCEFRNEGSWYRLYDISLEPIAENKLNLVLGQYDEHRNAGVYPTDALASGDSLRLNLIIPLI